MTLTAREMTPLGSDGGVEPEQLWSRPKPWEHWGNAVQRRQMAANGGKTQMVKGVKRRQILDRNLTPFPLGMTSSVPKPFKASGMVSITNRIANCRSFYPLR